MGQFSRGIYGRAADPVLRSGKNSGKKSSVRRLLPAQEAVNEDHPVFCDLAGEHLATEETVGHRWQRSLSSPGFFSPPLLLYLFSPPALVLCRLSHASVPAPPLFPGQAGDRHG